RAYSALASSALLPLVFVVGKRLSGDTTGLVAGACAAGAALSIQASHFGTVDSAVSLAGVTLLWLSLRIFDHARLRPRVAAGAVLGLAMATKLTAASFILIPRLAQLLRARRDGTGDSPGATVRTLLLL